MKPDCMHFYLDGRDQKLFRNSIDEVELAKTIIKTGESPRDVIHKAVKAEAAALVRQKKSWLADAHEDIIDAGVSEEDAWAAYVEGRVDEVAQALEPGVIEAMIDELDGGGDEDDEDEDDEDDDEDDNDKED